MMKILCACCLGLFPAITAQFTFKMCVKRQNRKNPPNSLFWGFKITQSHRCCYH